MTYEQQEPDPEDPVEAEDPVLQTEYVEKADRPDVETR